MDLHGGHHWIMGEHFRLFTTVHLRGDYLLISFTPTGSGLDLFLPCQLLLCFLLPEHSIFLRPEPIQNFFLKVITTKKNKVLKTKNHHLQVQMMVYIHSNLMIR